MLIRPMDRTTLRQSPHLSLGGALADGQIYGTFPTLALDDVGSTGRSIPTTASTQYASRLAQWFGPSAADLANVLPYIGNFCTNTLGFLR
jgi:uncharacterized protein (DUF1501 family)